jgi:hypothetical protein
VITREDMVSQSVFEFGKAALDAHGYLPIVDFREAFPYSLNEPLVGRSIVAVGFNFDDEGEQAEMGSSLTRRVYTIQMWTFGINNTAARNIANFLKFAMGRSGYVPLLDVAQDGTPEIDQLEVDGVSAERQIFPDPEPWQQFVWTTTTQVIDYYFASAL